MKFTVMIIPKNGIPFEEDFSVNSAKDFISQLDKYIENSDNIKGKRYEVEIVDSGNMCQSDLDYLDSLGIS